MSKKTLLQEYGFENYEQYFDMIIESHINGNFRQRNEQLLALKSDKRKEFVQYLKDVDQPEIIDALLIHLL